MPPVKKPPSVRVGGKRKKPESHTPAAAAGAGAGAGSGPAPAAGAGADVGAAPAPAASSIEPRPAAVDTGAIKRLVSALTTNHDTDIDPDIRNVQYRDYIFRRLAKLSLSATDIRIMLVRAGCFSHAPVLMPLPLRNDSGLCLDHGDEFRTEAMWRHLYQTVFVNASTPGETSADSLKWLIAFAVRNGCDLARRFRVRFGCIVDDSEMRFYTGWDGPESEPVTLLEYATRCADAHAVHTLVRLHESYHAVAADHTGGRYFNGHRWLVDALLDTKTAPARRRASNDWEYTLRYLCARVAANPMDASRWFRDSDHLAAVAAAAIATDCRLFYLMYRNRVPAYAAAIRKALVSNLQHIYELAYLVVGFCLL